MSRTYTVSIQSEAFPITLSKDRQSVGALRQELASRVRVEPDQITLISARDDTSSASDSGSAITLTDERDRLLEDKDSLSEDCLGYEAIVPIKFVPVSQFAHINKRVFAGRIGMMFGNVFENILSLRGPPGATRVSYDGPGDQQLIHGDAVMMSQSHDDLYFAKVTGPTSKTKVLSMLQDAIDVDGILTASDSSNIRKASRALLNPAFTKQALEGYADIMHDSLDEALVFFDRHASDGTNFDLGRSLRRLTWQTVERICVGTGPQRFKARLDKDGVPVSRFNEHLQYILQTAFRRALYPKALRRFSNKKWHRTIQELHDWLDEIIADRRNDVNAVPKTHDVLQHCLETSLDDGTRMSDDQIRHTCLTLIAAGTDTTAITLSTILHQLSINPKIQQKCLTELAKVGIDSDSQRSTIEQLNQVDYLEWIILEALRWLPPSPGMGKSATHKCAIQSGDVAADERILFHEGDWTFTSFVMMSFNELYYGKDIFTFNPERWAPEKRKARHPYCDAFFSAGSRNCIGRLLAMQELKVSC
jgi:cytochrome P450